MLVTIGIPFYNAEQTLTAAIRSIFAQTLTEWELILVDDGSTDASSLIAQAIADADPRVTVVSDGVNQQRASRLNQIARLANGRYLARMDADDLMHPDRLAEQVSFMEANHAVDILGTGLYAIDASDNPFSIHHYEVGENIIKSLFQHRLVMHPTVLGRTDWFLQNPYDEKYKRSEDQELWARTYNWTRFANIKKPLFFYRMLPSEETSALEKRLQLYVKSCEEERRLYREYGPKVGFTFTASIFIKSYLLEVAFRISTKIGFQNNLRRLLVNSKFQPIDKQQRFIANNTIRLILNTPVPGLQQSKQEYTSR